MIRIINRIAYKFSTDPLTNKIMMQKRINKLKQANP